MHRHQLFIRKVDIPDKIKIICHHTDLPGCIGNKSIIIFLGRIKQVPSQRCIYIRLMQHTRNGGQYIDL